MLYWIFTIGWRIYPAIFRFSDFHIFHLLQMLQLIDLQFCILYIYDKYRIILETSYCE